MKIINYLDVKELEVDNIKSMEEIIAIKNSSSDTLPVVESIPCAYDIIFSFLNKKSLLSCMLVSRSWNCFIKSSTKFMRKLEVVVDLNCQGFSKEDLNLLVDSERNFKTIEIKNYAEKNVHLVTFLKLYKWKSIKANAQFVPFPNLDETNLENLTTLEVIALNLSDVTRLIKISVNLKEITLTVNDGTVEDWKELSFNQMKKLKKLKLLLNRFFTREARNANHFLMTQGKALTDLELHGTVINEETLRHVSAMPMLESLTLKKCVCEFNVKHDMTVMKSLKSLKIFDDQFIHSTLFLRLVTVAENVTLYQTSFLKQDHIGHISRMKKIREIIVDDIELSNDEDPDYFPDLQTIKVKNPIKKSQQEIIAKQVFKRLTRFILCLFEEIVHHPHNLVKNVDLNLN